MVWKKKKEEPKEEIQEESKFLLNKPTQVKSARIISAEVLDSGLYKFVFLSNHKLGDVGEEFNL